MPDTDGAESAAYSRTARILVDEPPKKPVLGFDETADALAEVIRKSKPQFAIGIFAGWGSGKTTLMHMIREKLSPSDCVCVEFNAWRFESEPVLLVPLLDTIRGALEEWSKKQTDRSSRKRAERAAGRLARVVRGLAAGLSGEVGVPGALKIGFDAGKAMNAFSAGRHPTGPQSLYVAAFEELSNTMEEFRKGGATRVVIFIDDLDRCLPSKALNVLESLKLFFDLDGFIFVAGLDQRVVERAVRAHFAESGGNVSASNKDGEDADAIYRQELERYYPAKIFQLPYYLRLAPEGKLPELLDSMYDEARLLEEQKAYFSTLKVAEYLKYIAVNRRINPREVKRFLNSYILRVLSDKELESEKDFKPEVTLAVQVLESRKDWPPLYDAMLIEPTLFRNCLGRYRSANGSPGDESAFKILSPDLGIMPADLSEYLHSDLVKPLVDYSILERHLLHMDSTSTLAPRVSDAYRSLGSLRSKLREVLKLDFPRDSDRLYLPRDSDRDDLASGALGCWSDLSVILGSPFDELMQRLENRIDQLRTLSPGDETELGVAVRNIANGMYDISERIYRELRAGRDSLDVTPAEAEASDRDKYTAKVMAEIEVVLPASWYLIRRERTSDYRFDGLIIKPGSKQIVVETFSNPSFTGGEFSRAVKRIHESHELHVDGIFVIAQSSKAPGFKRLAADFTALSLPNRVVEWRSDAPDDGLSNAVKELTGESSS
jgi:hypothetical protein